MPGLRHRDGGAGGRGGFPLTALRKAVFLDRDGTIIREYGHFWEPSKIELIPGAAAAIQRLKAAGFAAVVATNQSGVAEGAFTEPQFWVGERRLEELLAAQGVRLDAVYFCPHHPTLGEPPYRADCACRKPKPGMLMQGAREVGVDLARSFMVGDSWVDVAAGQAAGTRTVRVQTVYGHGVAPFVSPGAPGAGHAAPTHAVADLGEASKWILKQSA